MDNKFYVIDDNDNEIEMEILFTFENEEYKSNYVVYFDPNTDTEEVFASKLDDEGGLLPITDDQEWLMIEEVVGAFEDEQQEEV